MSTLTISLTLIGSGLLIWGGLLLARKKPPVEKTPPKVAMDEFLDTKQGNSDKLNRRRP